MLRLLIGVDGILKHFLTGWRPNKYAGFQRSFIFGIGAAMHAIFHHSAIYFFTLSMI
jgi:hypothetical protein